VFNLDSIYERHQHGPGGGGAFSLVSASSSAESLPVAHVRSSNRLRQKRAECRRLPRLCGCRRLAGAFFLPPSEADDDSHPTGYELAPCMDKAATADRESIRDENFIPRML